MRMRTRSSCLPVKCPCTVDKRHLDPKISSRASYSSSSKNVHVAMMSLILDLRVVEREPVEFESDLGTYTYTAYVPMPSIPSILSYEYPILRSIRPFLHRWVLALDSTTGDSLLARLCSWRSRLRVAWREQHDYRGGRSIAGGGKRCDQVHYIALQSRRPS